MCCCKKKIEKLETELAEVKAEFEAMKAQGLLSNALSLPVSPLSWPRFDKGPSNDTHTLGQCRIRRESGGTLLPDTAYLT